MCNRAHLCGKCPRQHGVRRGSYEPKPLRSPKPEPFIIGRRLGDRPWVRPDHFHPTQVLTIPEPQASGIKEEPIARGTHMPNRADSLQAGCIVVLPLPLI